MGACGLKDHVMWTDNRGNNNDAQQLYGMVWCLFIQHQRTSYIAQITQYAEREMHEV